MSKSKSLQKILTPVVAAAWVVLLAPSHVEHAALVAHDDHVAHSDHVAYASHLDHASHVA